MEKRLQSLSGTICMISMALLGLFLFLQTISTLDISRSLGIVTLLPRLQNSILSIPGWRETNVMFFPSVTNFIWPYLHQFFEDSYSLNGYGKPSKRPFD